MTDLSFSLSVQKYFDDGVSIGVSIILKVSCMWIGFVGLFLEGKKRHFIMIGIILVTVEGKTHIASKLLLHAGV